jgi:hypothetical protein
MVVTRSNSPMINKASHIAWAAEAVAAFQKHCGAGKDASAVDAKSEDALED